MATVTPPKTVMQKVKDLYLMLETIEYRRSVRTFADEPLREEHIELIKHHLQTEELITGPLGRKFRIEFLQTGPMKDNAKIGTYGYLKNPQGFLIGMSANDKYALFEIAYVFQGLVLLLTEENVATCWLGGIFNQDDVRASTIVHDDEIVPAISPVGYKAEKSHFIGKMARRVLKPHKRRPVSEIAWINTFDTQLTDTTHHLYEPIQLGTLAPNAQNKQSWRVVASEDGKTLHLFVKFKLEKQVHDNFRGYACSPEYLDIGIFFKHFDLAMRSRGIQGKLVVDDPKFELPDDQMEYIITWKQQ